MFDWFSDPTAWAALLTLTLLEIVLGIDNIVFISILVDRRPPSAPRPASSASASPCSCASSFWPPSAGS